MCEICRKLDKAPVFRLPSKAFVEKTRQAGVWNIHATRDILPAIRMILDKQVWLYVDDLYSSIWLRIEVSKSVEVSDENIEDCLKRICSYAEDNFGPVAMNLRPLHNGLWEEFCEELFEDE